MRGLTRVVQIGEREFVARELTGAELRALMADLEAKTFDLLDDAMSADVPLIALSHICKANVDELRGLLPDTDVPLLEAAAKECNPRFFGLLQRVMAARQPPLQTST